MLPRAVRGLILPLQETLLGRETFRIWRELGAYPPTRERLLRLQRDGLTRLLDHARRHIPYWKNRLEGRLAPALADDPAALLAAVPVLTRAEIQRHREAMRWRDAPGKILTHTSSGTTDDNLCFYWGRARQGWDRAMRLRALARLGVFPGDHILHLWPHSPIRTWREKLAQKLRAVRDWLMNDVVIDLRPFTAERLDAVLRRCQSYRPAVLIAYPSWLVTLGEHVRAAQPHFRWPGLCLILCMGEVLFSFQRRFLEETFGVPVFQEYGSQDAGLIAHEDAQHVLRLNGEQMIVEVLRDGMPARPGELGEVVITHFYTEIMPFIRYATGDVVRQPAQPFLSPSEPGLPVFPVPEGRTSDLLATVDETLCPMRLVVEALVEHAGLREFSLHQTAADQLTILEIAGRNAGVSRRGEVEEMLRSFLGKQLQVEWKSGSQFAPLQSGKRRYVCSPVALRLIAHDRESGVSQARAWPQRLVEDVPV
jgi:phenylacetate-CoA ligase